MKTRLTVCAALLLFSLCGHSAICNSNMSATKPSSRYLNMGNGTVVDLKTNLMWSKCYYGQSGASCSGSPTLQTWKDALSRARTATTADYTDWRLPNIRELASLLEYRCHSPAINDSVFTAEPAGSIPVWTSTPYSAQPLSAWYITFGTGNEAHTYKTNLHYVRFVRDAPPIFRPLIEASNGRCLELQNGNTDDGAIVTTASCDSSEKQLWWYDTATKMIRSALNFNVCLDNAGQASNNSTVYAWSCSNGNSNQVFNWENNNLKNSHNDAYALTAGPNSGDAVHSYSFSSSNANQQWQWGTPVLSAPINYYQIVNRTGSTCMEVSGGTMANGTDIRHGTCTGASHQYWRYDPNTLQIISKKDSNFCLDNTGSVGDSQNIHLWTCDAANGNQKFVVNAPAILLNANTSIAIDAYDDGNAGQWTYSSSNTNQQWDWTP